MMIKDVRCDNYFKCNNSSTSSCHECKENKNIQLKSYFEEINPSHVSVYTKKEEIISLINLLKLGTKIEIITGELSKTGFITYKDDDHVLIEVDKREKYKYSKDKIDILRIFSN